MVFDPINVVPQLQSAPEERQGGASARCAALIYS